MSFSVDQFMQVKCKFQLTSESDSSESIHSNNERIRLCSHVDIDKNSTLIVMICANETSNNHIITYYIERRPQPSFITKPRTIIKQVYYHNYNEDIVTICLSENGNKLALVSASSTIYILPIKNILLNLHAKQLRSSQGKSMYFYDASIVNCCQLENPTSVAIFESPEALDKTIVIIANNKGEISFISVGDKKEIHKTKVNEAIRYIRIVRDRYSISLLITTETFRQFRYALELLKYHDRSTSPPSNQFNRNYSDEMAQVDRDISQPWEKKPVSIKLSSGSVQQNASIGAIFRAPSTRMGSQTSLLNSLTMRERPLHLIFYQSSHLLSVVDILGSQKTHSSGMRESLTEPRLLRFFPSKQYYYRPQKPTLVCKLYCLAPDEMITHLILTDRFIAIATDQHRCLINSRNCCNLKHTNLAMNLDPLVKEIAFNNEEKILSLLKSPVPHDQDSIIDSFLLVTTRSIYSIEARQSCRDMFVNLIDSHLGIRSSRVKENHSSNLLLACQLPGEFMPIDDYISRRKNSESNLIITSFLFHRDEIYERINFDSKAFSILFKLELDSLYEAYGDKLLIRGQFELANRFFQMAKFDHIKTLGKYIRLGAYRKTVEYITNILGDENEVLEEKERIELAKAGFDCILAKTIVERSKVTLYKVKLSRAKLKLLEETRKVKFPKLNPEGNLHARFMNASEAFRKSLLRIPLSNDPYQLCEHSPRGQVAKLSANTITMDSAFQDDDESTLTDNQDRFKNSTQESRLECEKSLIEFVKNYLPPSLFPYAMGQLVDYDLIDLADTITRSDLRVHDMIRILLKARDKNRALFREDRNEKIASKLTGTNQADLVKIDSSRPKFLEFITSPEVTKALVRDISLASDYLGYQKSSIHFRKYSFTALKQLETYRDYIKKKQQLYANQEGTQTSNNENGINFNLFNLQQKRVIENIFMEFLNACLEESADDSCRLWYNYINFYLNHVGSIKELEDDILKLLASSQSDCRLAITLYRAIAKDEEEKRRQQELSATKKSSSEDKHRVDTDNSHNNGIVKTQMESVETSYSLSKLFDNEFLMKLLERTLDLVPQSADLDALSDCIGVDGLMGPVPLPVENTWRQIFKTIQSAALAPPSQRREAFVDSNRF